MMFQGRKIQEVLSHVSVHEAYRGCSQKRESAKRANPQPGMQPALPAAGTDGCRQPCVCASAHTGVTLATDCIASDINL